MESHIHPVFLDRIKGTELTATNVKKKEIVDVVDWCAVMNHFPT